MTAKETIAKFASEGFGSWTQEQLNLVVSELDLSGTAEKSALKLLPETANEELETICKNAPLRALRQAVRNFGPTGFCRAMGQSVTHQR